MPASGLARRGSFAAARAANDNLLSVLFAFFRDSVDIATYPIRNKYFAPKSVSRAGQSLCLLISLGRTVRGRLAHCA